MGLVFEAAKELFCDRRYAPAARRFRAFSIHMLTLQNRARWLFLEEKPLSIPVSVKSEIENAVAATESRTVRRKKKNDDL
jgi:hypothetical protein